IWEEYKATLEKILANGTKTGTTWFHEIENIILSDIHTQKVKEEFKVQERNALALMPQHKPISKKRSKREWVIVNKSKKNQPTIGQVVTKRACFTDIVCYESKSKDKSLAGERSSKRVLQEKSSNEVKRTRTEELIDISPWVKYAKGEMNLVLEPEHFINRSEGSIISPEKVRSLWSKKENIKIMIEEPKAWAKKEEEILDSIKEELKQKEKIDLGPNWLREVFIPRDKEEYRNRHIEWSRGVLADDIGLALARMNLSKNKAQDTAQIIEKDSLLINSVAIICNLSITVKFLTTEPSSTRPHTVLPLHMINEDDKNPYYDDTIKKYMFYPHTSEFENLTYSEYFEKYLITLSSFTSSSYPIYRDNLSNYSIKCNKNILIRYQFLTIEDNELYFYQKLLLNIPARNESDYKSRPNGTYKENSYLISLILKKITKSIFNYTNLPNITS
ncbi:101_t:CDS:2, partial [Gigaspora margarita]